MQQKSLGYNAVLNCIKTVVTIIFPLITMPYINRILQVENMGRINFATSYVNYFIQVAGLGVANYAIREGAKVRESKEELKYFCNQIFTINCITTLVSYLILWGTLIIFPGLDNYLGIIAVLSINVAGATLGISWFYSIVEDYVYITIRTLLIQVISLLMMFSFVKSSKDVFVYVFILVVSNSGSAIFNLIHSRKYIVIGLTRRTEWKKHLGPIITLFASSIATIIYVNSDTTMIGLISGDYHNGLYSVSVKVYTILKNVLFSVFIVTLPRLSFYINNNQEDEYRSVLKKSLSLVILIMCPIIIGINILCNEVVLIVGGEGYMNATVSLHILSVAIFFSLTAAYFSYCILLPTGKEKVMMRAMVISAIVNVLLNFIMIPWMDEVGAAITTLISEILVVLIELPYVKSYLEINKKTILKSLASVCWIAVWCLLLRRVPLGFMAYTVLAILGSSVGYFLLLMVMRTEEIMEVISKVLKLEGKR